MSSAHPEEPKPARRRWGRRLAWGVAGLVALPVLMVVAVLGLLSTDGGTRWALGTVADQTPGLSLGRVEGRLIDAVTLHNLAVADDQGVWLTAEILIIDWRPRALFSGNLVIEALGGRDVVMSRLPTASQDGPPPEAEGGSFDPRLIARLALQKLDLDRLTLGPPVLGTPQPVVLTAEGAASGGQGGAVSGRFAVERLDAPGEAEVDFAYQPGGRLSLNAVAYEPRGGALAALLNLPGRPPVRVSLNGEGPVEAWDGRLLAEAEDVATLEGDLALRLTPGGPGPGSLGLSGVLSAGPNAPRPLAVLARPTIQVDLRVARGAEVTRLEALSASATGWSLTGEASLGAAGSLAGVLTAQVDETADYPDTVVTALAGFPLGQGRIEARLGGTLDAPQVEATVDARDTLVQAVSAQVEASLGDAVTFDLRGRLEGIAEDMPHLAPLTADGLDFVVTGRAAPDGAQVTLSTVTVLARALRLEASGDVALDPLEVTADLDARMADLSILAPMLNRPIGGSGRVTASLRTGPDGGATGPVQVVIDDFALGEPMADRLVAGTISLTTDLTLGENRLVLGDLALTTPGATATGRLALKDWQGLDGTISLGVPTLERLELGLTGAASLEAQLEGTLADPQVTGMVRLPDGSVRGVALADIAAAFAVSPQRLTLAEVTGRVAGAPTRAQAAIPFTGGPIEAEATQDLSGAALAPYGVGFEGPASLSMVLGGKDGVQVLRATLAGEALRYAGADLAAQGVEAEVVLRDLFGTPAGTFAVGLTAGAAAGVEWRRAQVEGTLEGTVVGISASIDGAPAAPYGATAQASVDLGRTPMRVRVDGLEVSGQGHRLALAAPTTLTLADGGALSLAETRLSLDGATARLALDFGPQRVALDLTASDVPLAIMTLLRPDMPVDGTIDVTAALSGPPSDPRGSFSVRSTDLSVPDADVPGLSMRAEGRVGGGRLTATATMAGVGETPANLQAEVPLVFSATGVPAVPGDRPLAASVDWQGPVQAIWNLVPQVGHRLAGQATVQARIEGTLDAPRFSGAGRLVDGTYENLEYGTVLQALQVTANLQRDGTVDLSLSATDGGDGRVTGDGRLTTPEVGASQLTGTLSLSQATLVRRDDLEATLGGDLRYEGSLDSGTLSGDLRTRGAEIQLGGGLGGGGAAALNVVEVNRQALGEGAGRPEPAAGAQTGDPFGNQVALRINVAIPGQIFVRGQGLDSEWQGDLTIRGTLADPRILGQLSVVRGTYDVIGKSFVLERGVVDLRGGERVNPALDVRAVHDAGDLTAIVLVSGTAQRPEIALESTPSLPRDEVLSRVLFGRGINDLGPTQAVAVARAASQLTGGGGGSDALDITGRLRSGLGLDVLSFGGGAEGPTVEAGKYISEDVYVGIEQGAGAASGSVNVEVEVTPRVTVKSKAGAGESDIGIEWKFDY